MPRVSKELSALEVKRLSAPGLHAVGGVAGLHLHISRTGARSWILRTMIAGKRCDLGLGGFPDVKIAQARDRARDAKDKIREGINPIEERRDRRAELEAANKKAMTFEEAFNAFFDQKKAGELANEKHAKQWRSTLAKYAFPTIGSVPVGEVTTNHLLIILKPFWTTKTETVSRVRQRIETVLDWATASGHREGANPARWKGNLQQMLSSPSALKNSNAQPAIALDQVADWFAKLRECEGIGASALMFLTLTAARSGEIRGATWRELDFENKLWTVPADRMKMKREHRVPLTDIAIGILREIPRFEGCDFVFPSRTGKQMSNMTISTVMQRLNKTEIDAGGTGFHDPRSLRAAVPHGLRSSFRDWAAERTNYPREMAEIALAHKVGSEVERAYLRTDMIERRRDMMEAWATFIGA